jgi:hypothetical protein
MYNQTIRRHIEQLARRIAKSGYGRSDIENWVAAERIILSDHLREMEELSKRCCCENGLDSGYGAHCVFGCYGCGGCHRPDD